MRRLWFAWLFLLFANNLVLAQSNPGLGFGQVPTATQWNSYFSAKQDFLGYLPLSTAGGTMLGKLTTIASASAIAGFNLPQGTAPSSPINGDMWTTSSGVYAQIAGSTVGPFGADPLRAYCYIGDGSAHPLSAVSSCNGINTTGWTLTQWQVLLPTAVSISDDADGDAINSYILAQGSNPVVIKLPGQAVINTSITSCAGSLYISGVGQGVSITVATAGITAFMHCQSATPPASASFQLKNLKIICNGVACGDAMDVLLNNSTEPNFLLDTVSVTTLGAGQWANGAMTVGAGGSRITNSVISLGSAGVIGGDCLSFSSASPFTVLIQILNTHLYWCATAEQVTSLVNNQGVEGVFNTNTNADQVLNFFNYTTVGTGYNPPEMVFYGTEVSYYRTLFSVNNAGSTYVSDWIIRDGWSIQLAPNSNSGSVTPATGVIDLGAAERVTIEGNTFVQAAGAAWDYLINVNGTGWQIERNYTPVLLGTISGGIIQIASSATEVVERDNDWAYAGTVVANNAYATVSVVSEAYIWNLTAGACTVVNSIRRGTISGRSIQCAGNSTVTLSGGAVNFSLPSSIFQGTVAPIVVAGNCRNGTTIYTSDTNGTPSFAANAWTFGLLCSGGGSAVVNFQWTAIGS